MTHDAQGHAAEIRCSNDACRRTWSVASGDSLTMTPVVERHPDGDRRWHPCPQCLREEPLGAGTAHRIRERTALDLASISGN